MKVLEGRVLVKWQLFRARKLGWKAKIKEKVDPWLMVS